MIMKLKIAVIAAAVGLSAAVGAYAAYDYYAGNHVEVKDVISTDATGAGAGQAVEASRINGTWSIQPDSEVYFSVTTSKETVNFAVKSVKGSWKLSTAEAAANSAEGKVDMAAISSGNSQRDNHIKGKDYLAADQFPEAVFTAKSFGNLPAEWKEGETVSFPIAGTMTVKGISKEVTFESKAQITGGQLKLEGSTVVTFEDFGMKNPHKVVLNTENNITVQLRLLLNREQAA